MAVDRPDAPPAAHAADRGAALALVESAAADANRSGRAHFATCRLELDACDPLAVFERAAGGDRFYWCQPARGVAIASRGAVSTLETKGPGRFDDAWASVSDVVSRVRVHGASPGSRAPIFVGGFAFADEPGADLRWQAFPASRLVLPELLVRRRAEVCEAFVSCRVAPGDAIAGVADRFARALGEARGDAARVWQSTAEIHPYPTPPAGGFESGDEYAVVADRTHDVYRGQVAAALREIESGALEKVVLARALDVRHPGRFDIEAFLASLGRIHPHCTVLAVGFSDSTLVAATPELLLRSDGARVETCALAGSAPRGRTPEEDDALGRTLSENPKEQAEHETVVRAIRAALAEPCGELAGPERPELMRVEGIQHLATPLAGRLAAGERAPSLLELAGRLHPTPAVGGLPETSARDWIARNEGLARGWYAGPVGFVDASGAGELWVALRSALVRNGAAADSVSQARLFAGGGIVAGSEPELELRETRLKLRALLAPLTEI